MIFVVGLALLATSLILLCFVAPHRKIPASLRARGDMKNGFWVSAHLEEGEESPSSSSRRQRGRSPTAKDLRRASAVSDVQSEDAVLILDDTTVEAGAAHRGGRAF